MFIYFCISPLVLLSLWSVLTNTPWKESEWIGESEMKRKKQWSLVMFKGHVRKGRAINKSWIASLQFQAYPWRQPDLRWLNLCQKRETSRITVLRSVISSRRGHTKTVKEDLLMLSENRMPAGSCACTRTHRAPLSHTVSWFAPHSLDSALKSKFGREDFKQIFNSALPTEEISVLWDSVLSESSRIVLERGRK